MSKDDSPMRKPLAPIAAAATGLYIGLTAGQAGACEPDRTDAASATTNSDIDVQVSDSRERLGESWTPDRMRAAKPMPTPRISREAAAPAAAEEDAAEE